MESLILFYEKVHNFCTVPLQILTKCISIIICKPWLVAKNSSVLDR